MSSFNKEVITNARALDEWAANEEKDGRSPSENIEEVNVSIGVMVTGLYGKADTIQKFGLAHFTNGTAPEFAKGIPYYVDLVIAELKSSLISSIQTQLSEDPWSEDVPANATQAGSAAGAVMPDVAVGSEQESLVGSDG